MDVVQPRRGPLQLRREVSQLADENDTRHGGQQATIDVRHPVRAQQEHPSRLSQPAGPRQLLHELQQQALHLVEIIRRMLVQDDDVGPQPLETPELLRVQELPHQRQRVHFSDTQQHDRQIPGDALTPEILLTERVGGNVRGTEARGVGAEDARRQPIEEHGLLIAEPEVLQRDVHMGERHRERPRGGAGVAILSRQSQRGRAIRGHAGGERSP